MVKQKELVANHFAHKPQGIVLERIQHLPAGGKMGDLPSELQHKSFVRTGSKKTGGPNLRLVRLEMDKPSLTVTAYIFNKFVHPKEDRYITPREAACLQDFPDDYEFCGSITQVQSQIGNAVPVRLGMAIAGSVADYLKGIGISGNVPIASFFTGAGGLDLGFEFYRDCDINFTTRYSTDNDEAAVETLRKNRPAWNPDLADIRQLELSGVLRQVGKREGILIGGPPCQSFSVAGKQLGTANELGLLYRNFVDHVSKLSPQVVVMENVFGLLQIKSGKAMSEIQDAFTHIGYQVAYKVLFAPDYGTPQKRRRLILVAVPAQNRLVSFNFPHPTHASDYNLLNLPRYRGAGESVEHLPTPTYRG